MNAFQDSKPAIGARPGALEIPADSPPPRIRLFEYDEASVEERDIDDVEALVPYAHTERTTWIDVQGLGDEAVLRRLAEIFGIHMLALADAVNFPQRAQTQVFDEHLLVINRAPDADFDSSEVVPQVCLLIHRQWVISFQARYFGFFEGVRTRIRSGGGLIRRSGPAYLGYALIDSLVDHYYPVVQAISEELDELEEGLFDDPDPESIAQLHGLQRRITTLRRVIRPQVEALYQLSHGETVFVDQPTRPFMQDAWDHARQIEGRLDTARETTLDAMNAVLATLGHRQNEIMKVLTLVGSIFIPLTFIAGIYGMNFEYMPELKTRLGYPLAISTMLAVAFAMFVYFRFKGWIGRRPRR